MLENCIIIAGMTFINKKINQIFPKIAKFLFFWAHKSPKTPGRIQFIGLFEFITSIFIIKTFYVFWFVCLFVC